MVTLCSGHTSKKLANVVLILTTPPCSENVNWIVFKDPIKLSSAEILELTDNMPMNNYREEQPLHGRKVYLNSIKN